MFWGKASRALLMYNASQTKNTFYAGNTKKDAVSQGNISKSKVINISQPAFINTMKCASNVLNTNHDYYQSWQCTLPFTPKR